MSEAENAGVELDGVTVTFGDVTALRDVSITAEEGEFFTLVGPSGCGKTTTLRTIAGFETPAAGGVHIDGRRVNDTPPEERNVGVVFQNYALFPHMTVRENVGYGLRFRDPPGAVSKQERVDELLSLVDMSEMGEREPSQLSGGQQQRIALARALAPGPDVLLLDEPLSALDARLRERLRVTIRDIQRDLEITTIYVTHDQAEALAVSDRVAVMNEGRIEQVDTPEAVYREPASRFVANFVGDNNLLDGEVVSTTPPRASVNGLDVEFPETASVTVGETVTLSVRPEAIRLDGGERSETSRTSEDERSEARPKRAPRNSERRSRERSESSGSETTLTTTVENCEFLGDAYRVHCTWNDQSILVKTDNRNPPDETVQLGIDADDIHLLSEP